MLEQLRGCSPKTRWGKPTRKPDVVHSKRSLFFLLKKSLQQIPTECPGLWLSCFRGIFLSPQKSHISGSKDAQSNMSRLPSKLRCPFLRQLIRKACSLCPERELCGYIVISPSFSPTWEKKNHIPGLSILRRFIAVHWHSPAHIRFIRDKSKLLLAANSYFLGAEFSACGLTDAKRAGRQLLARVRLCCQGFEGKKKLSQVGQLRNGFIFRVLVEWWQKWTSTIPPHPRLLPAAETRIRKPFLQPSVAAFQESLGVSFVSVRKH